MASSSHRENGGSEGEKVYIEPSIKTSEEENMCLPPTAAVAAAQQPQPQLQIIYINVVSACVSACVCVCVREEEMRGGENKFEAEHVVYVKEE